MIHWEGVSWAYAHGTLDDAVLRRHSLLIGHRRLFVAVIGSARTPI
jgi:hypothetical protein